MVYIPTRLVLLGPPSSRFWLYLCINRACNINILIINYLAHILINTIYLKKPFRRNIIALRPQPPEENVRLSVSSNGI